MEELLERMRGRSRWIPHNANPSDALTKILGAHVQPLMDLLKSGFYHLKTEEAELKERAAAKEKTGRAKARVRDQLPWSHQFWQVAVAICRGGQASV